MEIAKALKQKLSSGRPVTGLLATFQLWPGLVEIVQKAGFDYLIVDLEHGAHGDELVRDVCTVGRLAGFPIIIRTICADYPFVRKAMDLGPCGLMFPSVDDAATLDRARDAIYTAPRGNRRPGGAGVHWVTGFHTENWRREVEDDFIVLPQIETVNGLKNARAIARHPLTTAIAIGPYDLSASLGVCWQPESPILRKALETVRQAGLAAGKSTWIMGDGPTQVSLGFHFLCLGEVTGFLAGALAAADRAVKNAPAAVAAPSYPQLRSTSTGTTKARDRSPGSAGARSTGQRS